MDAMENLADNIANLADNLADLKDKKFPVLDDGFVRLVDVMGGDAAIVQAARISYGAGTKKVSEDRGLIRFLMRQRHTTPFEMAEIKLHVRVPMDAWRQWIRHRTANVNEYSTRYSEAIDTRQSTLPGEWRLQAKSNKQGSKGVLPEGFTKPEGGCPVHTHMESDSSCKCLPGGKHFTKLEKEFHEMAWKVYDERIQAGIAREVARKDLPLSTYTEAYWKVDLHNLFHFLGLRMDPHAQKEIRDYADVIGNEIVAKWCPLAWEAFQDYRLGGGFLSRLDIEMIKTQRVNSDEMISLGESFGWLNRKADGSLKTNRERSEFEAKAARLGVTEFPWSS